MSTHIRGMTIPETRQRNNGAGQQAYDKARAALALLDHE